MTYNLHGQQGTLEVSAFPLMADYAQATRARVSLRQHGGQTPLAEQEVECAPLRMTAARLTTAPPLPFGSYELEADFQNAAGASLGSARQDISYQQPSWWGNSFGLTDKVMPEWEPMKVAGNMVSVIYRDVQVAPSGLPARIVSKGGELLARPVAVAAVVDGAPAVLAPDAPRAAFGAANDVRVAWQGSERGNGLALRTAASMEFDGMMWFTLTLAPSGAQPVKLDRLSLRIPYTPRDAELLHCWSGIPEQPPYNQLPSNSIFAETPAVKGVVFRSNDEKTVKLYPRQLGSFVPYLCLMGMERGMAFFAENDRGWTQSLTTPAVAVERSDDSVDLVLNLICEPVTLAQPRVIEFGLQPLPLRRLRADWRSWPWWGLPFGFGMKGGVGSDLAFSLLPLNGDWSKVAERWRSDPLCARERGEVEASRTTFIKQFGREPTPYERFGAGIYFCLPSPGTVPADTREFSECWWSSGEHGATPDAAFVDFSAWCWHNWAATGVLEGYYSDGDFMGVEIADRGNLAYTLPDGHVQPGYGWRYVRQVYRRQRQTLWDRNIVPHICTHMTNSPFAPVLSFTDVMLDGEWQYQSPTEARDFLDIWPPARMRVNNIAKWHIIPRWLSWDNPSTSNVVGHYPVWQYRHERAYAGNLAVHDIDWLFWGHYSGVADARALRLREPDTEFVGYWSEHAVARHDYGDKVLVSAWKAPAGDDKGAICTVVIVNRGDARLDPATIRFDTHAMGLGADPDAVVAEDVDPSLLDPCQYAKDLSDVKEPDLPDDPGAQPSPEANEPTTPAPTPQTRAQHPDYRYTWSKGTLTCAIRRHDYRLFKFYVRGNS